MLVFGCGAWFGGCEEADLVWGRKDVGLECWCCERCWGGDEDCFEKGQKGVVCC